MFVVLNLPGDTVEHIMRWLDLPAHLRLREVSTICRDEIPRRITTLVVTNDCSLARRCHETVFLPAASPIRSITVDLGHKTRCVAIETSLAASFSSSGDGSIYYGGSASLEASATRDLPLLVRGHQPTELKIVNMVCGGHFSGALFALEENLSTIRQNMRILQLGLATGGPRPYQDPRSHHWCVLRLVRLLGGTMAGACSRRWGEGVGEGLATLTRELGTSVWPLNGATFAEKLERELNESRNVRANASMSNLGGEIGPARNSCWPRLRELRLSCGIMDGDLEGLAECLGSNMPNLEVLVLEGHSFRAPLTDLTAFAKALGSPLSSRTSPRNAARMKLTTLSLKHFKVEGIQGLTMLGEALSADNFPRLSMLSMDSCRLSDCQLQAIVAALPGMSPTLKTLSLRSNYALSADGISALAKVLQTGMLGTCADSDDRCASNGRGEIVRGCQEGKPRQCGNNGKKTFGPKREQHLRAEAGAEIGAAPLMVTASSVVVRTAMRAPAWSVSTDSATSTSTTPLSPATPRSPVTDSLPSAATCPVSIRRGNALQFPSRAPVPTRKPAPAYHPSPRLESLDLSYSCWWRKPRGKKTAGQAAPPLISLLKALSGGACPGLRVLRLAGCYFGDTVMEQLVSALTTGCRKLRVLDITGNLFGDAGISLLSDALRHGTTPPHLRVVAMSNKWSTPHRTELFSGMPPQDWKRAVEEWSEHQKRMRATTGSPDGTARLG